MNGLKIFGTSGIRGFANEEITVDMAAKLGETFATLLGNEGIVVVCRDVRIPAKAMQDALMAGLQAGGVDVADAGLAPTPAALWAVKEWGLDGAAIVTGSHTPPEIIGFLFFLSDTAELSEEEEKKFEKIFFEGPKRVSWIEFGGYSEIEIFDVYEEAILSMVDVDSIASESFKVVIDPGNGAATLTFDEVLEAADVRTVVINGVPDGRFPARDPYPRPEVLGDLAKTVVGSGADLGAATDSDGDRVIFADESGTVYFGDISGCIFISEILKRSKGGVVVTPINASSLVEWTAKKYGGKVVYCKVGPPNMVSALKREGAVFAFEETGKNIWPDAIFYGDAVLSTLKLLEIMADRGQDLSEIISEFPKYYHVKTGVRCPNELKEKVLEVAFEEWEKLGMQAEINTLDGIKIMYPDNSWLLLRPSNTEPFFRVYSEAKTQEKAQQLADLGLKLVEKALRTVKNFK